MGAISPPRDMQGGGLPARRALHTRVQSKGDVVTVAPPWACLPACLPACLLRAMRCSMPIAIGVCRFQMKATKLLNVEVMSKSDPFLQFCRLQVGGWWGECAAGGRAQPAPHPATSACLACLQLSHPRPRRARAPPGVPRVRTPLAMAMAWQEDGKTWLPVYKTETRKDCLSPTWDVISVRATQLNNGDLYRPLKIEVRCAALAGALAAGALGRLWPGPGGTRLAGRRAGAGVSRSRSAPLCNSRDEADGCRGTSAPVVVRAAAAAAEHPGASSWDDEYQGSTPARPSRHITRGTAAL